MSSAHLNGGSGSTIDRCSTLRTSTRKAAAAASQSSSIGITTSVGPNTETMPGISTSKRRKCCDVHCNSIWSVWYGIVVLCLQAYIVYKCVSRFLIYVALPWPNGKQPYLELNLFVGLVGAGVVLVPFYFISFMFKIGNLANDGYKLGFSLSACAMDPPSILARSSGLIRNAWHHGGPTAPFIHLVSAFCFVIPRIFIEAKLIEVGFLSRENIWKTDLDFMVPYKNRLQILHVITGGTINASLTTTQAPYHHPAAKIREYLDGDDTWHPCSPEFINYALALVVYSVRYPAVFWNTNKAFSFMFSAQLLANSFQNLMALGGFSVMYKVQALGPQNVLHKYEPFLLNKQICTLLYVLGCIIVTTSSCVLYMYGYQKFMAFVETERIKHTIMLREGKTSLWSYFSHCSAMCVLIALAVCQGPLLYDYTLIYKGSLDSAVLTCVVTTILHLFLWIVVWLCLTMKQSWKFKLRVTIGKNVVKSARSIKLLNDVDLQNQRGDDSDGGRTNTSSDTMMIVAFGKSFSVSDATPKKLIMNTLARAAIERDKHMEDGEEMQLLSGKDQENDGSRLNTIQRNNRNASASTNTIGGVGKQRVTFEDIDGGPSTSTLVANSPRPSHSAIGMGDTRSPRLARSRRQDEGSNLYPDADSNELNKNVANCSNTNSPSNYNQQQTNIPNGFHSDIEGEGVDDLPPPPGSSAEDDNASSTISPTTTTNGSSIGIPHSNGANVQQTNSSQRLIVSPRPIPRKSGVLTNPEVQDVHTPRSNRSLDSGLPQDDVTPRSDSLSTGSSSASPPDQQHHNNQNHGFDQGDSREQHRKSTSLDDININNEMMRNGTHLPNSNQAHNSQSYKSFSLQRPIGQQVAAPVVPNPASIPSSSAPIYATTSGMLSGGVQVINPDGTVTIRRQGAARTGVPPAVEEEDPYGRIMNMKLTTFSESQLQQQQLLSNPNHPQLNVGSRDPRIIDLNSTASSSNASISSTPPNSNLQMHSNQAYAHQPSNGSNFNTLPAQVNGMNNGLNSGNNDINGAVNGGNLGMAAHNTLPNRVNGSGISSNSSNKLFNAPSGRHFKPFDHRKMNPMADIQEDPSYGISGNQPQQPVNPVSTSTGSSPFAGRVNQIGNGGINGVGPNHSLIVSHVNSNMPHMPSELRHTNYSGGNVSGIPFSGASVQHQRQQQLVNPQVLEQRDSANFSMASSDSG